MSFIRRIINLGRPERLAHEIDRELAFHFREYVEELVDQGMTERNAVIAARRRFGNITGIGERTRDQDVVGWLDSLLRDLRYAARTLRRSPVFTTVAIASLALGIGANTAVYSLMDAVMIRALPVPAPDELMQVTSSDDDREGYFTNPLWEQVRDRQQAFETTSAFSETSFNTADGGEVRRIPGLWASGDFFTMFGMQPAAGRLFTRADDVRGCGGIGVLGHGFWQSEYGGQRDVIGKTISITGKPVQIIGVASPGFAGPEVGRDVHLYLPLCAEAYIRGTGSSLDRRSTYWLRVIGRRKPDVTAAQAIANLKSIAPESYTATVAPNWGAEGKAEWVKRTFSARPVESGMSEVRERYGKALKMLMGAVAFVLLIACANVANLLIARAAAREREVAIRLAMGAGRARLMRQLLTESVLLAAIGAIAGLFVAAWATGGLVAMISTPNSPVTLDLALNIRVLGFTALIASVTALFFGMVPAWRGTRISPQVAMKASARGVVEGASGHARFTLGKTLVATQVALSLMLLVGAGLMIGSLRNLRTLDPGFRAEGVLLVSVGFQRTGIPGPQLSSVQRGLLDRLRATPGVRAASIADLSPVGQSTWNDEVYVDGGSALTLKDRVVWFNEVSDGYFATLDIALLAGRDFDATDVPGSPRTAVVDQATARKFFGDASPLGKQFRTKQGDRYSDPFTIVGVVETSKYRSLRETSSATIYQTSRQNAEAASGVQLVVRASGDPLTLVPVVKKVIGDVHPLATMEFRTLSGQLDASLQRERMLAWLSGLFGGIALALSMLGLYGIMAYTVARRRNEIGVRIALGAGRGRVLRMVLSDVARVVTAGMVVGAAGAVASGKLVTSFLFGLAPTDARVLAAAAAVLALVALAAGLIPALRATRMDPVSALRED